MSNQTNATPAPSVTPEIIFVNLGYGRQYALRCPPTAQHPEGRIIPCHNRATAVTLQQRGVCER